LASELSRRVLLDTSVLVGPAPGGEGPAEAAISVVSVGELVAGTRRATVDEQTRARRYERLRRVTSLFEVFDVDEAVAERYGVLLAAARDAGRQTKATDLLIVATAATHALSLVTRDQAQAGIAGLGGVAATLL